MKQAIALLIIYNLFCQISAQRPCILEVGDSCRVDNRNTEFRSSPNYNYQLIATFNDENTDIIAELIGEKVINGYVKVKLVITQAENAEIGQLHNEEGWIKKKYLDCFTTINTNYNGTPSEDWDEDILMVEELKRRNRCTYSAVKHAGLLLARGRAKYNEENFEGALADISKAIDLPGVSNDLIVFYWYRAHAKSGIGDYQGAIEDFDYIIDNKDGLETDSIDFELNDVLCWKAQNLYFLDEDYKAKSILNIVIASDPEYGFAYYLRGLVKYFINDKQGCCKDLSKAAELGFEEAHDEIIAKCK